MSFTEELGPQCPCVWTSETQSNHDYTGASDLAVSRCMPRRLDLQPWLHPCVLRLIMKECTVYKSVVITKGGRGWAFVTVSLFRAPHLQRVLKPDPFSVQFKLGPWKLKPTRQNFHSTALDFCSQDYNTTHRWFRRLRRCRPKRLFLSSMTGPGRLRGRALQSARGTSK